jgi:Zn-dependent protease
MPGPRADRRGLPRLPRKAESTMLRSFKVGSAFGIPLYVHTTFLLLPAWVLYTQRHQGLVGILGGLAWLFAVFVCVLLHELGHALMARYYGIGTRDITLYPIGGVARLESTGEAPLEEICIALAGPAVNLVLLALLAPLGMLALVREVLAGGPERVFTLEQGWLVLLGRFTLALWFSNLVLLGFNLVPAFPMDGGRVLRAVLALGMGRLRATELAVGVGMLAALGLAVVAVGGQQPMLLVVALLVPLLGRLELRALRRLDAEQRAAQPAPVSVSWDRQRGAWVRGMDGRPVDVP